MSIIIAMVGLSGAGKTEAAKYFQSKGFQYLRFGQLVLDEAIKRGEVNEKTEREIRNGFRKKYGMGAMATLNLRRINKLLAAGNVVIDDLYSWDEYKILKNKYGQSRVIVVAALASPKVRYKRLAGRLYDKKKDPKAIYRQLSPGDAKSRDYDQIEKADQGGPIAMADYYVINESSPENYQKSLARIEKDLRKFLP